MASASTAEKIVSDEGAAQLPVIRIVRRKKNPNHAIVYVSGSRLQVTAVRVALRHNTLVTGQTFRVVASIREEVTRG
jgi:hypothetical protein